MAGAREENLIRRLEETITCFTTSFVQNSSQLGSRSSRVNFFPGSGSQSTLGALRVAYIAALSHKSLKQKKLLTKRDVYYMCRSLFYDPAVVDRALQSLSISVDAPRNDLSIVAAPKGIVVGNVRYADEMGCNVDVGMFGRGGCLIPPRPERMTGVLVGADAIVVVEKEAAFYSLLDDFAKYQLLETYVVITGKGYPDVGTREFIRALSSAHRRRGQDLPIFIVTDADPHGISIANCYVQSLLECSVKWLGVCPSHNGQLFNVRQSSLLGITERENAILRGLLKGWDDSKMHADALTLLISEAKHLQNAQVKFEMEALASELGRANVSGLTIYITERVREFQFGQGR